MGRRNDGRDARPQGKPSAPATTSPAAAGPSRLLPTGVVLLLVALAATAMLVLEHFGAGRLPGCGPGSGCDQAARSVWGRVPGLGWPVSFVGLAYFAGLLVAWILARGRLPGAALAVVLLGGVLSIGFMLVMALSGYFCQYCGAAHGANLALCGIALLPAGRGRGLARAEPLAAAMGSVFAVLLGGLVAADWLVGRAAEQAGEAGRAQTTAEIIAAASRPAEATHRPFTGRWRLGPDPAAIRIVMLTDYQCPDCRQIEAQVATLVKSRSDVSLSVKHFPMCADCNPHVGRTLHANACWAARAAEAAGILGGNAGFWKMHEWLFAQQGSFTDASLPPALQQLGFDPVKFQRVMQSPETLERVKADVQEGVDLGLYRTPMVFINGIELKDWHVRGYGAVTLTVEQVAAANPAPRSADADRPPLALERYIADWREEPQKSIPPAAAPRTLGSETAPVSIVMFGDYQEANTAKASGIILPLVRGRGDVRFEFRHYPFNQECNPTVPRTQHALACRAARSAEAARIVGGADAFWQMHEWLCARQAQLSDALLAAGAAELGLDAARFAAALADPAVGELIAGDCNAGKQLGLSEIPMLLINGRRVPRWQMRDRPDGEILERILREAAKSP